jgi:hypothetical protein
LEAVGLVPAVELFVPFPAPGGPASLQASGPNASSMTAEIPMLNARPPDALATMNF